MEVVGMRGSMFVRIYAAARGEMSFLLSFPVMGARERMRTLRMVSVAVMSLE